MGHRLSKIYTRTGDNGTTGLGDGSRVDKDDLRICVIGDIDELNSLIGLLRCHVKHTPQADDWQAILSRIQHWLFDLGGELSIPHFQLIQPAHISELEHSIDQLNQNVPPLKDFILPAGNLACSTAHLARSVCRRAERELVRLQRRDGNVQAVSLTLLNRLSDWLFVASRVMQLESGEPEVLWQKQQLST